MPLPAKVLPGDLITADHMNQIIDLLALHEQEIQALLAAQPGATGAVGIASISPATPRMGDEVKVSGHGFGLPALDVVTVAGTPVAIKPVANDGVTRSSDTVLVFDMPTVANVPAGGANVALQVQAAAGPATYQFLLLPPAQKTTGTIAFAVAQPKVSVIQAGFSYDFVFTLQAVTSLPDTYSLAASAGQGGAQWPVTLTDDNGTPISQLQIPTSATWFTKNLHVSVAVPQGASGQATVTLTASSSSNAAFNNTGTTQFTVNQPPAPTASFNGTLVLGTIRTSPNTTAVKLGPTITLPGGLETDLTFGVIFQHGQGGKHYDLSLQLSAGSDKWNATLQTQGPLTVSDPPSGLTNTVPVAVVLKPTGDAPLATLTITVTQREDPTVFGTVQQKMQIGQQ